jgi:hypothetical protein
MICWVPDSTELAWAAGFYDGEGSVWYRPPVRSGASSSRGGQGHVRISVQQNDPYVLERFKAAVGCGRVVGPYERKTGKHNPFWTYEAHRFGEVMAVVCFLWKFLSPIKREQLRAALLSHQRAALGA